MTYISRLKTCAVAAAILITPASALSQACHGTPSSGGLAYERGSLAIGQSNGLAATLAGRRTAFAAAARVADRGDDISSVGGDLRFSLQLPIARLSLCPGLGAGYVKTTLEPSDANPSFTMVTHALALRAGASVGFEQRVYKDLSVIPFFGARYAFTIYYLDLTPSQGEGEAAGDTTSTVELEYGLTARYKFLFAGWSAFRETDAPGQRPQGARFLLGLTWGAGARGNKE